MTPYNNHGSLTYENSNNNSNIIFIKKLFSTDQVNLYKYWCISFVIICDIKQCCSCPGWLSLPRLSWLSIKINFTFNFSFSAHPYSGLAQRVLALHFSRSPVSRLFSNFLRVLPHCVHRPPLPSPSQLDAAIVLSLKIISLNLVQWKKSTIREEGNRKSPHTMLLS